MSRTRERQRHAGRAIAWTAAGLLVGFGIAGAFLAMMPVEASWVSAAGGVVIMVWLALQRWRRLSREASE